MPRTTPKSKPPAITQKWCSWNPLGINMLSSSRLGLQLTYSFLKEDRCYDEIRNHYYKSFEHYSIEHGYFEYVLKIEEALVRVRAAAECDRVVVEFTPIEGAADLIVGARLEGAFDHRPRVRKDGDALAAAGRGRRGMTARLTGGDVAVDEDRILYPLRGGVGLVLAGSGARRFSAAKVGSLISAAKKRYLAATGKAVKSRKVAEYRRIASCSVNYVAIYVPQINKVVCTSTRAWCAGPVWGGYVFFVWDALFMGEQACVESKDLAYESMHAVLSQANGNGLLPGGMGHFVTTRDRSNPPLESFFALKLYRRYREKAFLRRCYPALKKSLRFQINNCDGNGDGLYEWFSFPFRMNAREKAADTKIGDLLVLGMGTGTLQGARYSAGMDNSPAFDDAEFDAKSHTMKQADVGYNALLVLAGECMERIAGILGHDADAKYFRRFREELAARVREKLWDEKAGIFKSRTWSGKFVNTLTPTNFYPMLGGIADRSQSRRMVREHLLNPKEFWGDYIIPTVARNHPSFKDQDYWRGRIWGPTNYLVHAGLRRAGFNREADRFARKSADLFMQEYRKDGHNHENYNAITGDGDDVNTIEGKVKSDAFYPWGSVLLLPSIEDDLHKVFDSA